MIRPHFLQSEPWETFQNNLGRQTFRASGEGWQWMAVLERGHLGSRLYCPYGPTAQHLGALREAINSLRQKALDLKVDFIRIEPFAPVTEENIKTFNATRAARDVQPAHTWQVDLTQSEDELLSAVTSGNRRSYRNATEKQITFRVSDNPADIEVFLSCIHEVSKRTGMRPHSDNYFRTQAETLMPLGAAKILIADVDKQPAATMISYDNKTVRGYAHAAAHYELRKNQPGAALVCFAMLDAKKQGKKIFDFYGIAPPHEPAHPLAGITTFKQSFGGYTVDYLGTWDIPLHKNRYRMIRMAHTVSKAKSRAIQLQKKLKRQ